MAMKLANVAARGGLVIAIAGVSAPTLVHGTEPPKRAIRLDDAFSSEQISEAVLSPDGRALAVVRFRPLKTVSGYVQPVDGVRGDVWLQDERGESLRALTNGLQDQSGSWNLQWSPDGQRLAFLRAKDGNVTLWSWSRATEKVTELSTRGIDHYSTPSFQWVDNHRILCLVLPEGERVPALDLRQGQVTERMKAAWARQARGEVTASVLDSRFFEYDQAELITLDTTTGQSRTLAATFRHDYLLMEGTLQHATSWWLSPTGQAVVFAMPVPMKNIADGKKTFLDDFSWRSVAVDLRLTNGERPRLNRALPQDVIAHTVSWSPDGQQLVFYAYGDSRAQPARLWRVHLSEGRVEPVDTADLRVTWRVEDDARRMGPQFAPLSWTGSRDPHLLVLAARQEAGAADEGREDWWLIGQDGPPHVLTASLETVPRELVLRTEDVAIGVADGEVWRIDVARGGARNLTAGLTEAVSVVHASDQAGPLTRLLISVGPQGLDRLIAGDWGKPVEASAEYLLDVGSGSAIPVTKPAGEAELVAYAPATNSAVYREDGWEGTYLWRTDVVNGTREQLLLANEFFREIAKPETRWFDYVSHEGVKRRGWVMLPAGYISGRRYPTVVTVRMGSISFQRDANLLPLHPDELGVFAAAGYLVFAPDFKEGYQYRTTETDGGFMRAGNDIHAALDKVVEMGLADPDRFFIEGWSGTGKSAITLITQTRRFKAAAAICMGNFPEFTHRSLVARYARNAHEWVFRDGRNYPGAPHALEQVRSGSIFTHVGLVETPVFLAHGDLDVIPFENSEEYFKALVFHGKRAQFVRYWGEEHALGFFNRANFSDLMQRQLAWFDDFGDISRDEEGRMIFEGGRVKSRGGAPALTPEDYAKFDVFRPSATEDTPAQETPTSEKGQ